MNRKSVVELARLGLLLATGVTLMAQGGPGGRNGMGGMRGGAMGDCGQCPACQQNQQTAQVSAEPLIEAETKWLRFMREEEKLARDVYTKLNETWKLNVFANISRSEQRHFEAIGILLERYGLSDQANSQAGVFTDATLQSLYNKLVSEGSASLTAALQAGVEIEKQDIKDLEAALAATNKTDIKRVYTNLLSGSINHLTAFERQLPAPAARP
jgi:hypothetical protein